MPREAPSRWVADQILERLSRGGEEQIQTLAWMRAHPEAQWLRDGESDQEVRDREQQAGVVGQPLVGVGLAALRAVPIVAGVIGVMERRTLGRRRVRRPVRGCGRPGAFGAPGGAASTAVPNRFQISRPPALEQLVETDRVTAGPGRADPGHEPGPEIGHEGVEAFLMLGATEGGQMGVDDGGGGTLVTEVDLELAEVLALLKQVSCVAVTQRMDMSGFLDAAGLERETEGALRVVRHMGSAAVAAPWPLWPLAGKRRRGWR